VWEAVWPARQRHARAMRDYFAAALMRLSTTEAQLVVDALFDLPTRSWSALVCSDTSAPDLVRVMTAVVSGLPWSVRRRMLSASPLGLARVLR
jgi:hypothetical protein